MEAEVAISKAAQCAPVAVSHKAGGAPALVSQKGSGKTRDFHPLIRSAGVASSQDCFTARDAIQCDMPESHTATKANSCMTTSAAAFGLPGVQHTLLSNTPSAGRATGKEEQSVGSLLHDQYPATSIGLFLLQRQEKTYRGLYSKPVGRSVPHTDIQLPNKNSSFRFGIKQTTDEVDAAKKLIFAPVPEATQEELALYKQTHHAYLPGEAIDRGYAVKHINLRTFRFGKKSATDSNIGAKQCINWVTAGESSKIVSKAIEDYHTVRHPDVGKSARSAAGQPPVPPGFSFGLPTAQDSASAEECFKMCCSVDCKQPPANSSIRRQKAADAALRTSAGDDERVFGIPTVRTDIKPPKRRPIDDHMNYGDDPAIGELLSPSPLTDYDIRAENFLEQLSREQVLSILRRSIGSSSEGDAALVYKAVDVAFEKAVNGKKTAAEAEASKADATTSHMRVPNDAIGASRPSPHSKVDEPTVSLDDVLEAYSNLIKEKVAVETRSLTQATELYMNQSPHNFP